MSQYDVVLLPNGNIRAPFRSDDHGLIAEAILEVRPNDPLFEDLLAQIKRDRPHVEKQFGNKYVDYLRTSTTAELHLQGQHDQESHGNRGGAGVDLELSEDERTYRKSIETELAERASKGMKPLSPASLKVYVINEVKRRKKEEKPTPAPAKTKARGIPATSGIDQLLGKSMEMSIPKEIREPVMMAIIEIEKLHTVPEDIVPVLVKSSVARGAHGSYSYRGGPMNEQPTSIAIKPTAKSLNPANAHPALTFAHEFGHYLDSQAELGVAGKHQGGPGRARATYHTNQTPEMKKFFAVVENSPSYKNMVDLGANPTSSERTQGYPKRSRLYQSKPETFARAYAQWVATKSGNTVLRTDLDGIRNRTDDLTSSSQWSDEEFAPISAALEEVFQSKGLLKSGITASGGGNPCHNETDGRFCSGDGFHSRGLEVFPEEAVQSIKEEVVRLQNKWGHRVTVVVDPSLTDDIAFVLLDDPNTIFLHPDFPAKIQTIIDNPDFLVKSIKDAITHEYGHNLSFELNRTNFELAEKLLDYFDVNPSIIRREVSEYGGTSITEAVAEAFLQHEKGIDNNWSRSVAKTFNRGFRNE